MVPRLRNIHMTNSIPYLHITRAEEAGHGHVMYGIIAFQSTGP